MRIEEIKKGKYKATIDVGTDYKGKRKRASKVFYASTKKDLNRQIKEWESMIDKGFYSSNLTVEDMMNQVWASVIRGKSGNSIPSYIRKKEMIVDSLGQIKLKNLSPRVIQQWIDDLAATKKQKGDGYLSPKTIRDCYSVLSKSCSIAVNWELIDHSPCHDVILPSIKKKEVQIMSKDDFRIFVDHLDELDLNLKVLFELALFGSLRRGEIMGIKEDDVMKDGRIYINSARYEVTRKNAFEKEVKTSSGERMCIVPQFVVDDIKDLNLHHKKEKLRLGELWIDSPYLIKEANGEPFHTHWASKKLRKYMESIGIEPITFHGLRHTYASMCISMGMDVATVSRRMGHSDPSITLKIYTHQFASQNAGDDPIATRFDSLVKNL